MKKLPIVLFANTLSYLDDLSIMRLSLVYPQKEDAFRNEYDTLTKQINKLGYERIKLHMYILNAIDEPHNMQPPPEGFEIDEETPLLRKYLFLMKNSNLPEQKMSILKIRLSHLISQRFHLEGPYINIVCPFDFILALHFAKIDSILETCGYFSNTERWVDLIDRRAAFAVVIKSFENRK